MCSVRLLGCRVEHLLHIAVVGCNQAAASRTQCCFDNSSETFIYGFHCLDGCVEGSGMPYHVPVRVVTHDKIILPAQDFCYQTISQFESTHFWLQVVRVYQRRLN
ncbi:hypothetical protein PS862_00011 [Pseudomonas fluorescens]|uniref:Uncharacterized protein n=1 Tax=Pseudomonas fluorescens TaxID=294 RepID=A0A5E7G1T1_PSEFL|nr:hypothetical protein PS862_00011 [Pseudomonas fluorescens]